MDAPLQVFNSPFELSLRREALDILYITHYSGINSVNILNDMLTRSLLLQEDYEISARHFGSVTITFSFIQIITTIISQAVCQLREQNRNVSFLPQPAPGTSSSFVSNVLLSYALYIW